MANILFIEKELRSDKLGIMYLSAVLKAKGHRVDIIQEYEELDKEFCDVYQYIMCSVMSGEYKWFIETIKRFKNFNDINTFKNCKVVVGGSHFTYFPEQGLEDPNIDYIVQGPAEDIICDLIEGKYIGQKLIKGTLPDLNKLPWSDRDLLSKYDYLNTGLRRVITQRFCPYRCQFCFNHLFNDLYKGDKQLRQRRSVEDVIKEMRFIQDNYKTDLILFNDDNFCFNGRDWVKEFCNDYIKYKINMPFSISCRADNIEPGMLYDLKNAGCVSIAVALEVANDDHRNNLLHKNIKKEDIEYFIKTCKSMGIKTRIHNMIGIPVENPYEDALETLEWNQKVQGDDPWASICQPYVKTGLWQYCIENGYLDKDKESFTYYDDSILNIKDKDKINNLVYWWYWAVKGNWDRKFLDIVLTIPLTNEKKEKIRNLRWEKGKDYLYGR